MTRKLASLLVLFVGVGLLLVFVGDRIGDRARVAEQGRTVLLPLVPLGPRDMSHGDRIELIYELPGIAGELRAGNWPNEGAVAVTLDEASVARSTRRYADGQLAGSEIALNYRFAATGPGFWPSDRPRLTFGDSFFLVTDRPITDYLDARFAVLRVDSQGDSVVIGLANNEAKLIGSEP